MIGLELHFRIGRQRSNICQNSSPTKSFSQRSHFTVFGTKLDGLDELAGEKKNGELKNPCLLEKITIPAEAVPAIRFELELSGISESTIFPDLVALSRELEILWSAHFGSPPAPS